jgi:hypothetical protein
MFLLFSCVSEEHEFRFKGWVCLMIRCLCAFQFMGTTAYETVEK